MMQQQAQRFRTFRPTPELRGRLQRKRWRDLLEGGPIADRVLRLVARVFMDDEALRHGVEHYRKSLQGTQSTEVDRRRRERALTALLDQLDTADPDGSRADRVVAELRAMEGDSPSTLRGVGILSSRDRVRFQGYVQRVWASTTVMGALFPAPPRA